MSKRTKSLSEAQISKLVLLESGALGLRLFRNHVGGFYTKDGVFQRTGLCKGSSDFIGWTKEGRFAAVEVKTATGRISQEQENFIKQVRKSGGFACIVRSVEDLKKSLDEYYRTI